MRHCPAPIPGHAKVAPPSFTAQPAEGTYVHGMYMEGARWDKAANTIVESKPKELHPPMPVMHILGVTQENMVTTGVYQCPV